MQRSDRVSGAFCLLFSLVIVRESFWLGLGNLHFPEAGFFPFVASIILGTLSLMLLLSTKVRKQKLVKKGEGITFNKQKLVKVLYVMAGLFFYTIFLNTLGFIFVTAILMGFMLGAIGRQKWYVVIIGTISTPFIAYVIFNVFLKVELPKGFLEF